MTSYETGTALNVISVDTFRVSGDTNLNLLDIKRRVVILDLTVLV
jgi:hypothetical protein